MAAMYAPVVIDFFVRLAIPELHRRILIDVVHLAQALVRFTINGPKVHIFCVVKQKGSALEVARALLAMNAPGGVPLQKPNAFSCSPTKIVIV